MLFFPDIPGDGGDYGWFLERIERCESWALMLCERELAMGRSVVLDFGFLGVAQRDRVCTACDGLGLPVQIHFLDVAAKVRWARVQRRNQAKGEDYVMEVTREMFDFCETLLEPLS